MNVKIAQKKVPTVPIKFIKYSKDQDFQGFKEQSIPPFKTGHKFKIMKTLFQNIKAINLFGFLAVLFVAGLTLAFTPAESQQKNVSAWTRILNENQEFEWVEQNLSGTCELDEEICRAVFPDNYDPSMHSDEDNKLNAINQEYTEGYVVVEQ